MIRNFKLNFIIIIFFASYKPVFSYPFTDSTGRKVEAVRTLEIIKIDGHLTEKVWQTHPTTGFTQRDPVEGVPSTEKTLVWVAYDDNSIYVAARLFDSHPDSIKSRLVRRDYNVESDLFSLYIDPYHDRRSGFAFTVNPAGVMKDMSIYNDSWTDDSWDGIWDSKARIDSLGWIVEIKIPFSQLRFNEKDKYIWGINFRRYISRKKEEDYFIYTPKKESGLASRFADLYGIEGIHPPQRIEILPFITSNEKFIRHQDGNPFNKFGKLGGNLGADLKIGLGSNLTIDAAINPDFGQVEVDPAVVNLSQYETYYDEKRPFFLEGANIFRFGRGGANNYWSFNWGDPDFFYSRRIGRTPQGSSTHDGFYDTPDRSKILGAAKMSGKIQSDWSIAALSALTSSEYGETDSVGIRFNEEVEPVTSYNLFRTQREFNQGAQAIGIIGTATLRDLKTPQMQNLLNSQAYTFGLDGWTFIDSSKTWVITGWTGFSRVEGNSNRMLNLQKSPHHYFQTTGQNYKNIDSSATSMNGYAGRFYINKQKGEFQLNAALGIISPGFESNDLGFQWNGDLINSHITAGYTWFKPDEIFRSKSINLAMYRSYDFGGRKMGDGYFIFTNGEFNNYYGFSLMCNYSPTTLNTKRTRGGPAMTEPPNWGFNISSWSDSRKDLVFDASYNYWKNEVDEYDWSVYANCEWKIAEGLSATIGPQFAYSKGNAQWVTSVSDPSSTSTFGGRYIFSNFNQSTLAGNIRLDWTFSPRFTLQLYLQPLISVGEYTKIKELAEPESYSFNTYGENGSTIILKDETYQISPSASQPGQYFEISNPNFNIKSLRGNAVLRWEYLPGSTLYFVWTHSRENQDNPGDFRINRDFKTLMNQTGDNIFLVKVTYWMNL